MSGADGKDIILSEEGSKEKESSVNQSPFSAYAVFSQITFIVLSPLLLFIWGGSWLVARFSLPSWLTGVFIVLGIITMIGSLVSYLYKLINRYGTDKKEKYQKVKYDRRDYDYYDDFRKEYKNKQ